MSDAMKLSELGMINDLKQMEMISQNLANATTGAYKRDLPVADAAVRFESMLTDFASGVQQRQLVPGVARHIDSSQGVLKFTGNPLDLAIEGEGFFELATAEGLRYTRGGAFRLDVAGRLVTTDGHGVNGLNGEIRMLNAAPRIDAQGRIWDGEDMVAQLKLMRFENAAELQRLGGGLYIATSEGEAGVSAVEGVRQGHLEASNVNVMDEMVRMISTTRHFETTQKVITGYDEMIGEAISTIAEF
jgi:flagellar basal-body rod protein FlgF